MDPWPACNPVMNSIEHTWDQMKRHIRNQVQPGDGLPQLRQNNVTPAQINHLIDGMRRRFQACIRARGTYTRY